MKFYRPTYCCNCGEKIERKEWRLLSSRRFCDLCASERTEYEWLIRAIVGFGAVGLLVGAVSIFRDPECSPSPRQLEPSPAATLRPAKVKSSTSETPSNQTASSTLTSPSAVAGASPPSKKTTAPVPLRDPERPKAPSAYCGALTKKGTPCSRKVKLAGSRCFQHEGKPAAEQE